MKLKIRRLMPSIALAALALSGLSAPMPALAQYGTHYYTSANLHYYYGHFPDLNDASQSDVYGTSSGVAADVAGGASAIANELGGGNTTASATVMPRPPLTENWAEYTGSSASLLYYFKLEGSNPGDAILVHLSAAGSATSSNGGGSYSSFQLTDQITCNGVPCSNALYIYTTARDTENTNFTVDSTFLMYVGHEYKMIMYASASAGLTYARDPDLPVSAYAAVDPLFTVLDSHGADYQFVGLPASALAPVPEPQAWSMMALGLAFAAWRKRRTTRA